MGFRYLAPDSVLGDPKGSAAPLPSNKVPGAKQDNLDFASSCIKYTPGASIRDIHRQYNPDTENRRFIVEYTNLSVDELREQLAQIEQNKADLELAIERRRQEAKGDVAQQVRDLILSNGYELDEILPLVTMRKRRGTSAKKAVPNTQYTRYVDPNDPSNYYIRGVLPGWMKQRMQEQGYDPSSRADRQAFKANYLTAVAG